MGNTKNVSKKKAREPLAKSSRRNTDNATEEDTPIIEDERFRFIQRDPRFIRLRKRDTKITIDKRFAHMMDNKDFDFVQKVDKYGRPWAIQPGSKTNLKKFYRLEDEEDDKENSESLDSEENDESEDPQEDASASDASTEDSEHESNQYNQDHASNQEELGSDEDSSFGKEYDPARGEGVSDSSSEEDDEKEDTVRIIRLEDGTIGNLDDDESADEMYRDIREPECPLGDATRRFAVVNMDWDNIHAMDLLKLFDGFKPKTGVVHSVTIYPSEFGKERMAKEDTEGPPTEIFQTKSSAKLDNESDAEESASQYSEEPEDEDELLQNQDGEEFDNEALRKYQLDRLRYYYAVVECDCVQTAKHIYEQCDGTEFEHSSILMDLRYIPDEMDFEGEEPKQTASELPSAAAFKPKAFVTAALQNSKVKLTWDEDDNDRFKVTRQKFSKDDLKKMDFQAYLASDAGDSSEEEEEDPEEVRRKYKALLEAGSSSDDDDDEDEDEDGNGGGKKKGKRDEEGDMEITFAPGLSEMASKLLDKKKEKEARKDETVFEANRRLQKEKRKSKKIQEQQTEADGYSDEMDGLAPEEAEDPFFQNVFDEKEFGVVEAKGAKSNSKKASKKEKKRSKEEDAENAAELDLLLLEDEADPLAHSKHHFDMDEIVKKSVSSKKKHHKNGGKKQDAVKEVQDDFQIDLKDERFQALLDAPQYAIDPTSSKFKKTPAMLKVMEERKRHRSVNEPEQGAATGATTTAADGKEHLQALVEKIRSKAGKQQDALQGRRKKPRLMPTAGK